MHATMNRRITIAQPTAGTAASLQRLPPGSRR